MTTQINLTELQKLIDANPNLLTSLQAQKQPEVKPKLRRIKEGMTIEVEEPVQEIVKEITPAQARKLQKEINGVPKRTRNITPEQKAILLQNLEKGREKLKALQEEKRKAREQIEFQPKQPEVLKFQAKTTSEVPKTVVVKKYVVKQKEPKPKQEQERPQTSRKKKGFQKSPLLYESEEEYFEDETDSGFETDKIMAHLDTDTTDGDSDAKIIRKIKKKVASIKKADKIVKRQLPPQVKQPIGINPFYN